MIHDLTKYTVKPSSGIRLVLASGSKVAIV